MSDTHPTPTSPRVDALFVQPFAHPVAISAMAGVGLVVSYLVAARDPIASWEIEVTRWLNQAPPLVAEGLWPVMQLGSLVGPVMVGGAILIFRRDRVVACLAVAIGGAAWLAVHGVKELVARGRPQVFMPDIVLPGGDATGFGYLSGHAAVAAAIAVVGMAVLPVRARPVALVLVALVGIARIVYGLHFPADVIGGWSFGTLLGLLVVTLLGDWHRARDA
ncbi:MAG: phosphatase PAP2 family protein [Acidimicrobiia bacterium]|nr:phosphatase PAP2 family protein [Acidimicrobiia bacterium]